MQLDIFSDSRDVMLRNDVLSALQRYDAAGARRALQALANEYPDDVAQVYFGSIGSERRCCDFAGALLRGGGAIDRRELAQR